MPWFFQESEYLIDHRTHSKNKSNLLLHYTNRENPVMSATQEYITWSQELSVGIRELDEQHKILIGLINQLYKKLS